MPFLTKTTISTSENASYGRVSGLVLFSEWRTRAFGSIGGHRPAAARIRLVGEDREHFPRLEIRCAGTLESIRKLVDAVAALHHR